MAEYIKSSDFIQAATVCHCDPKVIRQYIIDNINPNYTVNETQIAVRIAKYRTSGQLPLSSGNSVSYGEVLKSSSTTYDSHGNIKHQRITSEVPKGMRLEHYAEAIAELAQNLPILPTVSSPTTSNLDEDLATLYVSNDVHFGALMDGDESGKDYDTQKASTLIKEAYDDLFASTPPSKIGIIADLGDLLEVNDNRNMTPKSGNILAVDSRFYKILRAAYESFIYAINKALEKHEIVYFYNIGGNHDEIPAIAIREVMRVAFANNPRVIIDDSPTNIKYHQHGSVLLQFAHGHAMKMRQAGETMAADMQHVFSSTKHRFSHLGHTHKDAVYDSPICRAESHRNIAPLNHYTFEHGYRTNGNTMKAITYHANKGEVSRNLFNVQ